MTARRRSAISLAELIAVGAVTCIVLALGYSAYRTYHVKREVAEGLATASELIPAVTEFFRRHGEVPAQLDLPEQLKAGGFAAVEVVDGRIDVRYGARADSAIAGRQISLTPYETVDRNVVWICGNRAPGAGLEPLGFANGGRRTALVQTTIEARYLSQDCR